MAAETAPKKKKLPIWLIIVIVVACLCLAIGLIGTLTLIPKPETITKSNTQANENTVDESGPTSTPLPTDTTLPTNTPKPTNTLSPTKTPLPPTATPDPTLIQIGTYLVGTDIQPGIYRGQAGDDFMESCYWARLGDLSGSLDALIANDNSIGQYYVEIRETDYAFETACELRFLPTLPEPPDEFPLKIMTGTYLVGIDIQPGTYKGQTGTEIEDTCYWARLKDVSGEMNSIITNDNASGQFYLEVQSGDFALSTACELERVED